MIYPEFIPIYAGMGILFVLLVVILILLILLLRKGKQGGAVSMSQYQTDVYPENYRETSGVSYQSTPSTSSTGYSGYGSVVFCKNCATQYDASAKCCPKCGTPR